MSSSEAGQQGPDVDETLQAGIAAARAGRRDQARELLTRVVQQDDRNVTAWLWLSGVVEDLSNRESCLQHVLAIDPGNEAARRGLSRVRQQRLDETLQAGIKAARLGQRDHARKLLTQAVEMDEKNATAWLWLGSVVTSLDDREVCLENVLTLDPTNESARRGLEEVRQEKALLPGPQPVRAEPVASTAPVSVPLPTDGSSAGWTLSPVDEFENENLCPYCAALTDPAARKCPSCGHSLWIKKRKREGRSSWLWIALCLQIYDLLQYVALVVLVLILMRYVSQDPTFAELLNPFVEVGGGVTIDLVLRIFLLVALGFLLFSLFTTASMWLRWKPGFYIFLVGAVLGLIQAIAVLLRAGSLGLCFGIIGVALAFAKVLLAFQLQDDFFFDWTRILLRPDRNISGGIDYMVHGNRYAKLGMWAMAVVHFQRAVGHLPDKIEPHLALARAYVYVRRYDRAQAALDEARRIDPNDALVQDMSALLQQALANAAA